MFDVLDTGQVPPIILVHVVEPKVVELICVFFLCFLLMYDLIDRLELLVNAFYLFHVGRGAQHVDSPSLRVESVVLASKGEVV